jgi:hypothetical protein
MSSIAPTARTSVATRVGVTEKRPGREQRDEARGAFACRCAGEEESEPVDSDRDRESDEVHPVDGAT